MGASLMAWVGLATAGASAAGSATEWTERASKIAQSSDATVGFSAACGSPPRTVSVNPDHVLRGASTLKVGVVLADAIQRGASGGAVRSDDYTRRAIIESDNAAANDLFARIGGGIPSRGVEATNALFSALGMRRTAFDGPYINTSARSQKVTTASDLRVLAENLQRLARDGSGPLAAQGGTQQQASALIDLMSKSTYPSIFSGLSNAEIAHKSGWLADAQNDLVILVMPGRESCAVGFVSEGLSLAQAQKIGSQLTREVLQPLARTPSRGNVPSAGRSSQAETSAEATASRTDRMPTEASATATNTTTAAGADSHQESNPEVSWVSDWRLWALVGIAGAIILIVARQRQLNRRRRSRAARRGRSR